jgi:hypothetical protein
MEARYVALLILVPFALVFAYATWHEYRRFKIEGRSTYGLSYDPETNTTHVGPIPEDEEGFDPKEFDPDLLETLAKEDEEKAARSADQDSESETADQTTRDTEDSDPDDKSQDTRT